MSTTDPLLPLLATIERLDRDATLPMAVSARLDEVADEWLHERRPNLAAVRKALVELMRGTWLAGREQKFRDDAPLASMLRVAAEALEEITTPLPDGSVKCLVPLVCEGVDGEARCLACIARAALATIRRMAEEVERG